MSCFLADFVENGAEKLILASDWLLFLMFLLICKKIEFQLNRKTAGYVARTAPNELIFKGLCRERRGEADSGLRLASNFDVYTYLQKIQHFK